MRKGKILIIALAALLVITGMTTADRYFAITRAISMFASTYRETVNYYVDEVNPNLLARKAFEAMLASLDPYTNFIPEDEIENFRTMSTGQYGGIGALTHTFDDKVIVTTVYDGFAAQKGGLHVGDQVMAVDDIPLQGKTKEEIDKLVRGQIGRNIKLKIRRLGTVEPFELNFKRERIQIPSVPYHGMVDEKTGYIKLNEFTINCSRDVTNAFKDLKEQNMSRLILDLRGNPGGLLIEAVKIVNIFIPKGKEVVSTKGKIEEYNSVYKALDNPLDTEIPLIILTNNNSASASEIVAGALQDYDRAVIVGEKSFGKGLVQVPRELSFNNQVKITTAKYYTPSGRCIQALDYSNRNPDGSVGKVPDSLKTAFKTTAGRTVFDGGGVDPDIQLEDDAFDALVRAISDNGLLLEYATGYYYDHDTIPEPGEFHLSEKETDELISWLADQEFHFATRTEKELGEINELSSSEKQLSKQLEKVSTLLTNSKDLLLESNRDILRNLCEQQIVKTYYFENGRVENSLQNDPMIQRSIEFLNTPEAYKNLLQ